jgi:hypothetical protein
VDCRGIGRARHQPVEGVDLAHEMALAEAADRRIAAHRADRLARSNETSPVRAPIRAATAAASQPA